MKLSNPVLKIKKGLIMNIIKFFLALTLSLPFGNILANDFECKRFAGDIQLFPVPDGECPILNYREKYFPDLTFLHQQQIPQTCFIGQLEGSLDKMRITGQVFSGLTTNRLGESSFLTAASFIKLYNADNSEKLGNVVTQDIIMNLNDDSKEYLTMIKGSQYFNGGKGHFEIHGNVFIGARFKGTLCLED